MKAWLKRLFERWFRTQVVMKRLGTVLTVLTLLTVGMMATGCASLQGGDPVRVDVASDAKGAAVGVNPTMLKQVWDWSCDNWGKLATGAVVGGAAYWGGEKQGWWGGSHVSDSGNSASSQSQNTENKSVNKNATASPTVDIQGDNNTIHQTIYQVYGPMAPVGP